MTRVSLKLVIAACVAVVVLGAGGAWLIVRQMRSAPVAPSAEMATSTPMTESIGTSVEGRDILATTYGHGPTRLLFVGGTHGGYEWNTVLLSYDLMDYLAAHPEAIPGGVSVTVIPELNVDGVYKATGKVGPFSPSDVSSNETLVKSARFNADNVDLNRNFDCKWQATSTWQSTPVSGGSAPFSEPETRALRDYILKVHPAAEVFFHSASGSVYASQCGNGILPGTRELMQAYADASGYNAVDVFDAYATSGAEDDWSATLGIPAITVELTTHTDVEWDRNLAGVKALLALYSKASAQ